MKHCIVNTEDKEILDCLKNLGYSCIPVIESDRVSKPISRHSDVLYRKLSDDTVIASACQKENFSFLNKAGYNILVCDNLSPGYNTESYLNFIINDKYIICNPKTALKMESEYTTNKKTINVKQGYTSCSVVCVNNEAYITDDENIYNTLSENNIACLKIKKGDIELNGYNYGFIGGASVKLDEENILFLGDIKDLTDKNNVIEFCRKYNMNTLFIKDKKLKDIGSALIL